jgi:hypothetical protein
MIAWVLSFVQIVERNIETRSLVLSIAAMGVTLFYIIDVDQENENSWNEWCLQVKYISCAACAISAVSGLGNLPLPENA